MPLLTCKVWDRAYIPGINYGWTNAYKGIYNSQRAQNIEGPFVKDANFKDIRPLSISVSRYLKGF